MRRRTQLNNARPGIDRGRDPLVRLWMLRILVMLEAHRQFVRADGLTDDLVAQTLDLEHWIDVPDGKFDAAAARRELRDLHRLAEKSSAQVEPSGCLRANVSRISKLLELTEIDQRILTFAVLLHSEMALNRLADTLGRLSSRKMIHALSVILQLPETDVRSSLNSRGALARCGLVQLDPDGHFDMSSKLNLLSNGFAELMTVEEVDPVMVLKGVVCPAGHGELTVADYSHIQPSLDVLLPYLRNAMATGRRGVNIYLHGVPGTGKSQFARALAADMGCELFEIASEDADGDPVQGWGRLRAFRAAQSFFAQRRSLIVFDEVEDVFDDGDTFGGAKSTAQSRKAWINRTLEENPVPTLWLSNSVRGLDPAFIRRFDMVIELPVPPRKQRERILQDSCGDFLAQASVSRMAELEVLAPAIVARASSVIRSISAELEPHVAAVAFEQLISSTLEAQGHRALVRHDPDRLPETYDPTFIQADADLRQVATGLSASRSGRLCLYGPPGTGKTAYGRWLAEQLGMPLHVKRASDLMSKWVGENEKNIADAFREASLAGAILLIDEVDSFLQSRREAQRGWEVTLVNEMLTQMESYAGVFIASTNLMEGLDEAALRRFDLKVKFDFLRSEQAWKLLHRHCALLGLPDVSPELDARLRRLRKLTPGDFAAVQRQHRFRPIENAEAFVAALEAECAVKADARAPIGFLV